MNVPLSLKTTIAPTTILDVLNVKTAIPALMGKNFQENCHRKLGRGFGYGWVFNDFVLIFVYFSLLKQERIHFPLNHLLNTSMSGNLDGDGLPSFLVFIVDLPANQHILALDPNT